MKKHLLFGLVIIIVAVVSFRGGVSAYTRPLKKTVSLHATDAAYRDGLFLGRFDAEAGRSHRVCLGRWSTLPDRASFASGYEDGYMQAAGQTQN
jgi:hypothetical protein